MYRANLDHWEYGIDTGQEVLAPTWEQLKALILELDEDKQTLVTYGDEEAGDYMAVGGGNGRYICYLSYDDEEKIFMLVDENVSPDSSEEVELVTGGQRGRFHRRECVSLPAVLMAAEAYYRTHAPDAGLCWQE